MGMLTDGNPRPRISCAEGGAGAKQSFKDECDINNIMAKYVQTGLITHVADNRGLFSDVSEVGSYQEAIQRVRDTHEFFDKLPASMRTSFGNDAAVFLDFISDPANADEIRRLGLDQTVTPIEASEEPPSEAPSPPVEEEVEAP